MEAMNSTPLMSTSTGPVPVAVRAVKRVSMARLLCMSRRPTSAMRRIPFSSSLMLRSMWVSFAVGGG